MTRRPGRRAATAVACAVLTAACAVLTAAGAVPSGATAQPPDEPVRAAVSEDQLRELADRAASDRAALAELRRVDRVDGRPIDVGRLLEGASGAGLDARLETLADRSAPPGGPPAANSGTARDDAASILAQRRFQPPDVPRPFRGVLEAIGTALIAAGDAIAGLVPGGAPLAWVILGLAVLALATVLASRMVRRRTGPAGAAAIAASGLPVADPDSLERAADEAERRGDAALALRLRFRAGLVRLHAAGAIRLRPSLSNAQVAARLRSPEFDRLATEFDTVAYGGRHPDPGELDRQRSGWSQVLEQADRR